MQSPQPRWTIYQGGANATWFVPTLYWMISGVLITISPKAISVTPRRNGSLLGGRCLTSHGQADPDATLTSAAHRKGGNGMRKTFAILALAIAGLLLAAGGRPWAQRGPIKVGLIVSQSGLGSTNGKEMIAGLELFLAEQKHQLAGREVKLMIEDDQSQPAVGLAKAKMLVEGQRVDVLVGPVSAPVGYPMAVYIDQKKIPALFPVVAADDVTQRKRSPYVVRTGWTSSQPYHPMGKWVYDNLKYKKIAMIAADTAFGWEALAGFQRSFEEAGGQIMQKLWVPVPTPDFVPYVANVRRDVDAVFAQFAGADALNFTKQYAKAGLKDKLPLLGVGTLTDEGVLRDMGDEVLGVVTALHYSGVVATPANKKFAQAYEAKYKQMPSYYAEGAYVAGIALKAALEAIGGEIENVDRFLAALRKVNLADAPRGPISFDEYGNPVQNIYVRKVERVGGRLQNTVIHTFTGVSQFWTYKPEDYLKSPVYSRDYPPCRHCS